MLNFREIFGEIWAFGQFSLSASNFHKFRLSNSARRSQKVPEEVANNTSEAHTDKAWYSLVRSKE